MSRAPQVMVQVGPVVFFQDIPKLMNSTQTDKKDWMEACSGSFRELLHLGKLGVTISRPLSAATRQFRGPDLLSWPWTMGSSSEIPGVMLESNHCKGNKEWAWESLANYPFLLLEASCKSWVNIICSYMRIRWIKVNMLIKKEKEVFKGLRFLKSRQEGIRLLRA